MGFFSNKIILVSSTLYNMAGDELNRTNYLKTTVVGGVLGNSNSSLGDMITNAYLDGPGMRTRRFFRWADSSDRYDEVGVPTGSLGSVSSADSAVVQSEIPADPGKTVQVQRVDSGPFDYSYFAEQYMFLNHPLMIEDEWSSDIDTNTNTVSLILDDIVFDSFSLSANEGANYVYAIYSQVDDLTGDWGDAQIFIYEIGSGGSPVLDALTFSSASTGQFVPYIPVRLDNEFISEDYLPDVYKQAKRAYRKSMDANIDKLIDTIADNEDLAEIDYAYVVFGVPLNVLENASREYLFRFFDRCRLAQTIDGPDYNAIQGAIDAYEDALEAWQDWKVAQSDPEDPLYGTSEPIRLPQPANVGTAIHIRSNGNTDTNFNMAIEWGAITKTSGSGLKKPDAEVGEIWLETSAVSIGKMKWVISGNKKIKTSSGEMIKPININWQVSEDYWETLTITDMIHRNKIYKNKAVTISASEALDVPMDPPESGFIVPLHMATVRDMRLVDSTQMMTAASYVVFNCYQIVKKKWYQTGIFKIAVFVAMIAVSVATAGSSAALMPGILGTAGSVGAALGLTGFIGILAGAILNSIAAMIVSQLLMMGSTFVFGEKFGAIIGSVLSMVVVSGGSMLSSGFSVGETFRVLTSASSLMRLSRTLTTGVQGYMQAEAQSYYKKAENLRRQSAAELRSLSEQFAEEFGYGRAFIDTLSLTDTPYGNSNDGQSSSGYKIESSDAFLARTLLTGSDIAEITLNMITGYTDAMLNLDNLA